MKVTADQAVCDYVSARGGVLWVRSTRHRCCGGAVTSLRVTTRRPRDAEDYTDVDCGLPVALRMLARAGAPDELMVELRGITRKRPVALWNGCTFKM